jgi:hypothetical protein
MIFQLNHRYPADALPESDLARSRCRDELVVHPATLFSNFPIGNPTSFYESVRDSAFHEQLLANRWIRADSAKTPWFFTSLTFNCMEYVPFPISDMLAAVRNTIAIEFNLRLAGF